LIELIGIIGTDMRKKEYWEEVENPQDFRINLDVNQSI
jgi:hypothetical protein